MKDEIKRDWHDLTIGTKKMFKEFFNKKTNKKQRANMWTFTRLIVPLITITCSFIGILLNNKVLLVVSGCIAGFGAITDFMDGRSSRKHKSYSDYGKLLDQISDKVFAFLICINLLFINLNYIFILIGEVLISIVNITYKCRYKNLNIESTLMGKFKQFPLFITLAIGYISGIDKVYCIISNIFIVFTFIVELLTVFSYIKVNNKKLKGKI